MNERDLQQIHAEMIHAFSEALSIVVGGLAREMDALKLTETLRSQIEAAKALNAHPMAVKIATESLAAIEAESVLQNKTTH